MYDKHWESDGSDEVNLREFTKRKRENRLAYKLARKVQYTGAQLT